MKRTLQAALLCALTILILGVNRLTTGKGLPAYPRFAYQCQSKASRFPKKAAPTQPQRTKIASWDRFLDDYEPPIRKGCSGVTLPARLVQKYMDQRVEWNGIFKAVLDKESNPRVLIAMKARTFDVKPSCAGAAIRRRPLYHVHSLFAVHYTAFGCR